MGRIASVSFSSGNNAQIAKHLNEGTVEQLRRNHEGKPPCDIVRRIGFELQNLLAVRKNTPEARLLENEPVRKDSRLLLPCGPGAPTRVPDRH